MNEIATAPTLIGVILVVVVGSALLYFGLDWLLFPARALKELRRIAEATERTQRMVGQIRIPENLIVPENVQPKVQPYPEGVPIPYTS